MVRFPSTLIQSPYLRAWDFAYVHCKQSGIQDAALLRLNAGGCLADLLPIVHRSTDLAHLL